MAICSSSRSPVLSLSLLTMPLTLEDALIGVCGRRSRRSRTFHLLKPCDNGSCGQCRATHPSAGRCVPEPTVTHTSARQALLASPFP